MQPPLSRCISAFSERPPAQSGPCDGAVPSCELMCFPPKAAPSLSDQPERFVAGFRFRDVRFRYGCTSGRGKKNGAGALKDFFSLSFPVKHHRSTSVVCFWPVEALGRADHGGALRQVSVRVAAVVEGGEASRSGPLGG